MILRFPDATLRLSLKIFLSHSRFSSCGQLTPLLTDGWRETPHKAGPCRASCGRPDHYAQQ